MEGIRYGRKRNGIRRDLKKKVEHWLESITDEEVRKAAAKDVIVTGGAIASMLLGERVNDYDVYFRTKDTTEKIALYYCNQFIELNKDRNKSCNDYKPQVRLQEIVNIKGETEERVVIWMQSAGVVGEDQSEYLYFESQNPDVTEEFAESLLNQLGSDSKDPSAPSYRPIFLSANAITLSDSVQLVTRFYGEPDKIHNNYDFVHAMSYYDYAKDELHLPASALESLLSRTLVYQGSLYPIASIFRMKKFLERGWRISAGQQLKIMWQISEINLKDPHVMREQLTGVDQAYMWQLIEALKTVEPEKIDSAYVSTIIDKIFS
jgi:hypothetical protein